MKVSVVIPTFNNAEYVLEAVRSVLGQSYPDLEVLVVDDGSTDNTREAVTGIADGRVRYISMDHRRGNYFARNKGISEARGQFLAFLDADDIWMRDKLSKQMAALERIPEAGVSFTDHLLFEDGDRRSFSKDCINTYPDEARDHSRFLRRLLRGNFIITSSVVVRKEILDRLGPFDTAFHNAMDYDMWLRIVFNTKCYYIPEALVLKRNHQGNISRNKVTSMIAVSYILDKFLAEKARHAFFSADFESLIRQQKEFARYHLGLEYLMAQDFENAKRCLEACHVPGKFFFRTVALLAARTQSKLLLAAIRRYRKMRVESQLKPQNLPEAPNTPDGRERPQTPALKLSVIIPTLNRPSDLTVALESLARQTRPPEEVFIMDQSENDDTRRTVEAIQAKYLSRAASFIYIHQKEKSCVRARNAGMEKITGDIVSFLDDDSEVRDNYYERIMDYFEKNPTWGGIGGSLIREDMLKGLKGWVRILLWKFFLISNRDGLMSRSGFGYPIYERPVQNVTRVEMLHGCNMNFRVSAVGQDRFDPWFLGYGFREDAEFSYRISKKAPLWMVPDAQLHHWESPSARLDVDHLKRMEIRNYHYVFRKHKEKGWLSRFLFFYSLGGLLLIDLMEVISRRTEAKLKKFKAGLSETLSISQTKKRM